MRNLAKAVGKPDLGGESLPIVFKTLHDAGVSIRRSELTMVAGVPGAGKSTIALAIALRAAVPTLYICADTNAHTMAMRLYSMITGQPQRESERILLEQPSLAKDNLRMAGHIFWSFDSAPTLNDIYDEVFAFTEVWGDTPHLIVVDNLMDVTLDSGEEFAGMRTIMKEFKFMSRDTNASIVVLHHTSEAFQGEPCPPLRAVQGKVNQLPALIMTVGQQGGLLGVASVKNRYGRADSSGGSPVFLQFNPEYMYIADVDHR